MRDNKFKFAKRLISCDKNILEFIKNSDIFMEIAYKDKKDLLQELDIYQEMILKKLQELDLTSAMKKVKSAITLIQENQEYFNLDPELSKFLQIQQKVNQEREFHYDKILRRYNNLLNEELSEENLDNFCKLLAMLKEEVDGDNSKFGLNEIQDKINEYFFYIKKMYILINSYKILEYQKASSKILNFAQEIKSVHYQNLKGLTLTLYRNLVTEQLISLSKSHHSITINELSQELNVMPEDVVKVINLIQNKINTPIEKFDYKAELVIFK